MNLSFMRRRGMLLLLGAALVLAIGVWGCNGLDNTPVSSNVSPDASMGKVTPQLLSVMGIQDRHTPELMSDPDVIGTATTLDDNGDPAIMLLVTSQKALAGAPHSIEGIPVKAVFTDKIVAMKGPPGGGGGGGGGTNHKAIQTPPIKLGTSGGWADDLANGYCCGGTLGALIQVGGQKRILSNYHVFEADIVPGGNGIVATTGDDIIQPGLIDVNCNKNNAQAVATLVVSHSLPGNNVDCSSANIISGMVDPSGAILEIGTISSTTVAAFVGQAVKKSGRTTGLSRADVSGLNATVSISYENECAGGTAFTKTFTGQILTTNKGSKFLAGGDSGSLMVEDVSSNPRAVGLLFAGSSTVAVAQPINEVLNFRNATMVGN